MIRASLSGLVAAVFSLFAYSYQEALGNPFGFGLLLFGPLLIGTSCAAGKLVSRTVMANGVTAAVSGAAVLGVMVASNDKDGGGLLVLVITATAFFVIGVLPVILAAGAWGSWRPNDR